MKPETERWVQLSDEDVQMAEAALERELYAPCVFHCQQAIEKMLKAVWVERAPEGYPPKEHKLVPLARKAQLQMDEKQKAFLEDLSRQYQPTRYADVAVEYSRQEAENYYQGTQEILGWLRQQLS